MDADEIDSLRELRQAHRNRLKVLELREAREGGSCPPEVLIEIRDIKKRIEDIDKQIKNSSTGVQQLTILKNNASASPIPIFLVAILILAAISAAAIFWLNRKDPSTSLSNPTLAVSTNSPSVAMTPTATSNVAGVATALIPTTDVVQPIEVSVKATNTAILPTIISSPTLVPQVQGSLNCSFIDELVTKADILQWIDIPSGSSRLAGVQIRTMSMVSIPEGWVVQRGGSDEYGPIDLPVNIVASVYSPESCRPLTKPSVPDLNCTFIDVLRSQAKILQLIEIPPGSGRLAGLQIRTNSTIDVPAGWIIQRGAGDEYGPISLPADTVASVYSPESCRPLK